ncbi:transglycosylase domain-containing protein [Alkalibacter saccharofermentans]|uniref:Penicillin-binding protein 1A n=1 Tax=Alkalibacter saccharofermentans DSM 14828 TaxID=1120975 RepID=A0A1M4XC69_9FIRM|nr:PBP1A family penicillin-binding protein [Alkalibacter saccharofermentans]SHE91010.1 penicillin-binding protein 1A [Alkalibacter saccharofermentans DSM 14828]
MKRALMIIAALILLIAASAVVFFLSIEAADVEGFEYKPNQKTIIFSDDGEEIGEIYEENRTYVTLDRIPEDLKNAIVAVEDNRFYIHNGFDLVGITRAFLTNFRAGTISEGASTITQQLARNIFEEISTEKTAARKIKEIKTAVMLEKRFGKEQILEMYLNEIYLGGGAYGVQEASVRYFGKNVWELNLAQCALIAGLPQAPSAYQPDVYFDRAKARQEKVLQRMVEEGFITEDASVGAKAEELEIRNSSSEEKVGRYKKNYEAFIRTVIDEYTEIYKDANYIDKDQEARSEALESLKRDGLRIYTSINAKIQEKAVESVSLAIENYSLTEATGAIVTIDAKNGAILAYYGGTSDIDFASTPRQPGSTLKPLIYSAALQEGIIQENTLLVDRRTDFNGYSPSNFSNRYYGYVTIRQALVQSLNIPAVQTMNDLGIEKTLSYLEEMGIQTIDKEDFRLPTALGGMTYGVTPLDMATAYTIFANGGAKTDPWSILSVDGSNGRNIYRKNLSQTEDDNIIDEDIAEYISGILVDNVVRGTGKNAGNKFVTGGKTGTSSESKDLWFVGFTGNATTSIWLGNPDRKGIGGSGSYCAWGYGEYMSNIGDYLLNSNYNLVSGESGYELETIYVLLDENAISGGSPYVDETMIAELSVLEEDLHFFENVRVLRVEVDRSTGKLFAQGKCLEKDKEVRFYLPENVPEECDKSHILDRLREIFQR